MNIEQAPMPGHEILQALLDIRELLQKLVRLSGSDIHRAAAVAKPDDAQRNARARLGLAVVTLGMGACEGCGRTGDAQGRTLAVSFATGATMCIDCLRRAVAFVGAGPRDEQK